MALVAPRRGIGRTDRKEMCCVCLFDSTHIATFVRKDTPTAARRAWHDTHPVGGAAGSTRVALRMSCSESVPRGGDRPLGLYRTPRLASRALGYRSATEGRPCASDRVWRTRLLASYRLCVPFGGSVEPTLVNQPIPCPQQCTRILCRVGVLVGVFKGIDRPSRCSQRDLPPTTAAGPQSSRPQPQASRPQHSGSAHTKCSHAGGSHASGSPLSC